MSFAQMGIRFLNKRRIRTAMSIMAIMLGVGILTGVNVTADSIEAGINAQIYEKLGNNDIIARGNSSIDGGWFNADDGKSLIESVPGVKAVVPRIIKSHRNFPQLNHSGGWNTIMVGLDVDNPDERGFGTCNITSSLNDKYENTSRLEDLLIFYSGLRLPVVVSQEYASRFNILPGDPLYILPENPDLLVGGDSIDNTNTSTWLNATIVGIIQDTSEAVRDFMPPAQIWDLYPPSIAVYLDLDNAWNFVFNSHKAKANMLFIQANHPAQVEQIREKIESLYGQTVFPGGIFTANVKTLFTEGILQVNFMMRGIFSIFSGISLLVCAIIIKNLLEMAKEEQTHEIGVMRAIGVTKGKILTLYIVQIIFISVIGSAIGILFGYYLSSFFVTSYVDAANATGTDFSSYTLQPVITPNTILIGMSTGVLISLVFGFFPARSAANIDPLEALRSRTEKPKQSLIIRTIKKTSSFAISLAMTIGGIVTVGSVFGGLFLLDIINPELIITLFIGVILLVVGIVLLAAFFFPVFIPMVANLFYPFIGKMKKVTSRNLIRYSRQTKNTFAMLAIGLCMMITVGTIMNSAYEGAYPGGKTITGGDLRIGDFYRGHVPKDPHAKGLKELPSVKYAAPIRFSFGFEGLTRIGRLSTGRTFGGTTDSIFGPVKESLHLAVFDPLEYAGIHKKDSIVRLSTPGDTITSMMSKLDDPYTILLHDKLARRLGGVKEGEYVRVRFDGFEADLKVVGIVEILPGFYWTYYSTDKPLEKQFVGAISWNTYDKIMDTTFGKTDVIARNKVDPLSNISGYSLPVSTPEEESLWGYAASPIDYNSLNQIAEQTGLIESKTQRAVSPFFGIPPFKWKTNVTLYDPDVNLSEYSSSPAEGSLQKENLGTVLNKTWALQNVLWHEDGAISQDWNTMFSRAYVIDPKTDAEFGNTTIRGVYDNVPQSNRSSIEEIFKWAEKEMPQKPVCILNEIYVNINISSGKIDYVKKFEPGETIRIYYNDSIYTDFLVIATTNSHYQYEYIDDEGLHHGDTAVFNYKTLSFNTYLANSSEKNWNYFFEVTDAEPNSIFIPKSSIDMPGLFVNNLIPDLIEQMVNLNTKNSQPNSTIDIPSIINQTLSSLILTNSSPYYGLINTTDLIGNYTFNGESYYFDGVQLTYMGEEQNLTINLDFIQGDQILEGIINGTYPVSIENFTTHVIYNLKEGATAEDIRNFINVMNELCKTVPTLENVTFFAPKLFMLEDSGLYDVYFFVGTQDKSHIESAYYEIENYYAENGLNWNPRYVERASEMEENVGGILGLIVNMFFGVLSFALITSLLGLAISTTISVKKRYAEIGTLRTLGFSNKQILQMIIGEGVITGIFGIIVGLLAGLLIAFLIISNLPFMIFLPIVFAPPIELFVLGSILLTISTIIVSFIPALSAVKIDIAEAIRTKGE